MKKFLLVFLVLPLMFSSFALASDRSILSHYTLFIDCKTYNNNLKTDFEYDTMIYNFLLYDDFSGGLLMKTEWSHGQRTDSGYIYVKYDYVKNENFRLVFDDGSYFNCYWDKENDDDFWLSFGDDVYFRFSLSHSFDILKDMVRK